MQGTITDITIALAKMAFAALINLAAIGANNLFLLRATIRTNTTTTSQAYLVYDKETGEYTFDGSVEGTSQ